MKLQKLESKIETIIFGHISSKMATVDHTMVEPAAAAAAIAFSLIS